MSPTDSSLMPQSSQRRREWGLLLLGIGTGVMISGTYAIVAYGVHVERVLIVASLMNLVAAYLVKKDR